jgi:hypothetical protein
MSDYFENIGEIHNSSPMPADGLIKVPQSALDALPYILGNIPYDEIVYVDRQTVTLDSKTKAVMIDTKDFVSTLPASEVSLREKPAVMRVIASIGGSALEGFLVDYRHIGFPLQRDYGLSDGKDSIRFQEHQEKYGTAFPLGILLNNSGSAEYIGREEVRDSAEHMMKRVDDFIAEKWPKMPKCIYTVPDPEDAIQKPNTEKAEGVDQQTNQTSSDTPANTNLP